MKNLITFLFFIVPFMAQSQDSDLQHQDYVYKAYIKSVDCKKRILNLSSSLSITFDDLENEEKIYQWSIVHYNADWTPSNLVESDYCNGILDRNIERYEFSENTFTEYIQYNLRIRPWTISGNYLLKIYEENENGDLSLAITRRFMIVDRQVKTTVKAARPAKVGTLHTHQELDFTVIDKKEMIRTPKSEVKATVLQNGRWDNAIVGLTPYIMRGEEIIFDYQGKVIFLAGKDFRFIDLRSFQQDNPKIDIIETFDDGYEILLSPEQKKERDMNLFNRGGIRKQLLFNNLDEDCKGMPCEDYADVFFQLDSPEPIQDTEVYLFGALTDWRIQPYYKMIYNEDAGGYIGNFSLKQGFYSYLYATVSNRDKTPNFKKTEGTDIDTKNRYSVLIYYRPFGTRYDQLISVAHLIIPND